MAGKKLSVLTIHLLSPGRGPARELFLSPGAAETFCDDTVLDLGAASSNGPSELAFRLNWEWECSRRLRRPPAVRRPRARGSSAAPARADAQGQCRRADGAREPHAVGPHGAWIISPDVAG